MIVLTIGFNNFAFKNDKMALQALSALNTAVQVEENYHKGDLVYYPADRKHSSSRRIELKVVEAGQFVRSKPGAEPDHEEEPVKLLDFNGKVHQMPGGGQ